MVMMTINKHKKISGLTGFTTFIGAVSLFGSTHFCVRSVCSLSGNRVADRKASTSMSSDMAKPRNGDNSIAVIFRIIISMLE
jgi:hypothetical protein